MTTATMDRFTKAYLGIPPNGHRASPSSPARTYADRRRSADIRARYDPAETTVDNAKHWGMTDACDAELTRSLDFVVPNMPS